MSKNVLLLVCGGIHPPSYSGQILAAIAQDETLDRLCWAVSFPSSGLNVFSPFALRQSLEPAFGTAPCQGQLPGLIIWAFSAGCVGAVALATYWQRYRGPVLAIFLVDGWGVPRPPGLRVHRLSHDRMTHDTSRWLGAGDEDFWADPPVSHLTLWQQPHRTEGWATAQQQVGERLTAEAFLCLRSRDYARSYDLNINSP
ncbi:hypothetical protein PGN35_005915 [Nodosilinea sp. PGN35]|uniref:hypothetical protein n=1 Tax=Nodosilinea sp. PGN35 TaxID=3020489 RepID=UPI0023B30B15|nr:hypothetical protein [Nodosilinea sp. TSF1-S3]MDF0367798.1 hypothetical protein [Nodosilinea sp. TSF1-S3]